jgi:soluble lytic murein transglycosylase-like protein
MDNAVLIDMARLAAQRYGLNEALFCALVEQESDWHPEATRYEPAFYEHWVTPLIVPQQLSDGEAKGRSTSWGLCQVMGQTAREHGYVGPFQNMCDDPAIGLDMGAKVFASKLKGAGGDTHTALLHWNGGKNLAYPGEVIDRIDRYAVGGVDLSASDA